jgi:hypothetical protein
MSEDERMTYKVITLKGSDNYEDWKLSISSVLLSKDILDFIGLSKATIDAADKRKAGKCFALIIQSLSPVITSSLPADCPDPLYPKLPKGCSPLGASPAHILSPSWRKASDSGAGTLPHRHS